MKKSAIILSLLLFQLQTILSQVSTMEFGSISQTEIDMATYQPDPQAEAVVLFDLGDSRFIDVPTGYDIQFIRTRRIKILSKAGIRYSEVSIPIFHRDNQYETVPSIEAFSYNFNNGKLEKIPLDQSTIYEEKINNSWRVKKFVFPDVRQGTIIEYKYILETPFQFNLPGWKFQDRIPTIYSKYTVRMIPFYEYIFIAQGINKFDSQESHADPQKRHFGAVAEIYGSNLGSGVVFQDLVHTYVMKNVPAFRDESHITSVSDYIMKIDFQESKFYSPEGGSVEVISTWPLLIKDLLKADDFGKYISSSERQAKNIIEKELMLTDKSAVEKCQTIINYVKSKYAWDGFSAKFTIKSPKDLINKKTGNTAEINLFMTGLLHAAGINASPVLLSTRDNGKIKIDYPFLDFFNYVVVLVSLDNKTFLADGTDSFTRYDRIPPKCINEKGLIISNEGEKWIPLDLQYNSIDQKTITINIEPEAAKMDVSLVVQAAEYDSYMYKKSFSNDTVELKKYFSKSGINQISNLQTLNYGKASLPYTISCQGISEAERLDNKIIISPFLKFIPETNRLTQPTRNYPVDFNYASTSGFKVNVNIPAGYKVLSSPETQIIDNDLVNISIEYNIVDGMIYINGSYTYKKAVYQPAEYSRLKSFIDIIVKEFNEPLVFEKV